MARHHRRDFDWVVVGSGFGGSVAALRLAQKGYDVAIVEAGRRWSRTDFPRSTWDVRRHLWLPRLGCTGALRVDLLRHALVVGGAGVGGGSLVYGNTLFAPLPPFFESPAIAALGGARELMPYYELARKMLGVTTNPHLTEADRLLRETARDLGREATFTPSPVGVHFGAPGVPAPDPYFLGEGPGRTGCTLCGGCFVGCRVGAKNTLDTNYLWLAERLGCAVIAETRVTSLRPLSRDGSAGYALRLARATRRGGGAPPELRARGVVVAGGVLGTLELLLAARRDGRLPRLSGRLGELVRTNSETIVGVTTRDASVDWSRGLAASSSVFPDAHTQVQADRYPAGSDAVGLLATLSVDAGGALPRPLRFLAAVARGPRDFLRTALPFGFARRSALLVVMQDLDSSLRLRLGRSWLAPARGLVSEQVGRSAPAVIPVANDFARRMAARADGVARSSLGEVLLGVPATAHILGGCVIADDPARGVVDAQCRAFGYANLIVCDGSAVPHNLGVNPALSITALAERALSFVPPKDGDRSRWRPLAVDRAWGTQDLLVRA